MQSSEVSIERQEQINVARNLVACLQLAKERGMVAAEIIEKMVGKIDAQDAPAIYRTAIELDNEPAKQALASRFAIEQLFPTAAKADEGQIVPKSDFGEFMDLVDRERTGRVTEQEYKEAGARMKPDMAAISYSLMVRYQRSYEERGFTEHAEKLNLPLRVLRELSPEYEKAIEKQMMDDAKYEDDRANPGKKAYYRFLELAGSNTAYLVKPNEWEEHAQTVHGKDAMMLCAMVAHRTGSVVQVSQQQMEASQRAQKALWKIHGDDIIAGLEKAVENRKIKSPDKPTTVEEIAKLMDIDLSLRNEVLSSNARRGQVDEALPNRAGGEAGKERPGGGIPRSGR